MRGISIAKALLIPLIVLFGLAGVILILVGGVKMFNLPADQITQDGLQYPLGYFTNCENYTNIIGQNTTTTGDYRTALANVCKAQQRPYVFYLAVTASMVAISIISSLCIGWKVPRSWLYWLAIQNAVTTAMLFTLIYVMMKALSDGNAYYSIDCSGFDNSTITQLQQSNKYVCWRGAGAELRTASRFWRKLLPCVWIGIAFSLFSLFLYDMLLSAIWHGKGRYGYGPGAAPAAGSYGTGPYGAAPAPAATSGPRDPYYYSEPPRRPAVP
jgi:hypothetical protein